MSSASRNRRRVTERFPALVPVRLAQRRLFKKVSDRRASYRYATCQHDEDLAFLIKEHSSILERRLDGVDPQLQRNKVQNLALAASRIDGVILAPGETFSFWKLVGRATARGGYAEGLVLRDGVPASGVGGGLCQISNMLHWLVLHSDLAVVERHRHSYDPFPDSDRVVPFGTGATLLEGILDLKVHNPTESDHQVRLRLTPTHLVGQLRSTQPPTRYEIVERDHRFVREGDDVIRSNRIVRLRITDQAGAAQISPALGHVEGDGAAPLDPDGAAAVQPGKDTEVTLFTNRCRVGYAVPDDRLS